MDSWDAARSGGHEANAETVSNLIYKSSNKGLVWMTAKRLGPGVCIKGVEMGLSMTAGGTPRVPAIGWFGPACGLQNCLAAMGAITVEVE